MKELQSLKRKKAYGYVFLGWVLFVIVGFIKRKKPASFHSGKVDMLELLEEEPMTD